MIPAPAGPAPAGSAPGGPQPLVHVRVLGTVTASADGSEIALGGPRVRALLAALVMARGRVQSADALLDAVWGERTPGVRSALRANISRLRSTPLGPHLRGGRQGYALTAGQGLAVDYWSLMDLAEASAPPPPAAIDELAAVAGAVAVDGAGDSPFLIHARTEARAAVR
uniref:AfsR/SARP family transcriptional regulator n=1 Tax=Microbacterium yannicii TaxID=671622 RepID=UPI00047479F7